MDSMAHQLSKAIHSGSIQSLGGKDALDACRNGAILLDLREDYLAELKVFDVPNIYHCPLSKYQEWHSLLPDDTLLILADTSGNKTRQVVLQLTREGHNNIASLGGGMVDWERSGLPVITDRRHMLSGSCMCQLKARSSRKKAEK